VGANRFSGFYVMADYINRLAWNLNKSIWDCACYCENVPACCEPNPVFTDQFARVRCRRQ
jgi:hypothetical protein